MRKNINRIPSSLGRKKRVIIIAIFICISPVIVYCISVFIYFPFTADKLIYFELPQKTDAIVILEGEDRTRVEYAIALLEKNFSNTLIFPGLQIEKNKQIILNWIAKNNSNIRFIYNSGPTSTYEEALVTRKLVKELKLSSLLLVTSSYHSYRASWIFRKVLPDVHVISTPVPLGKEWFSLELSKTDQFHKDVIHAEQTKFLFYYLAYGWRIY